MHIKTVSYSKTFPLAAYSNERIGIEFELHEGESADKALEHAKQLCEEFHKKSNPHLYENNAQASQEEKAEVVKSYLKLNLKKPTLEESYLSMIKMSTDVNNLKKMFEPLLKVYPNLEEAYNNKLKELTNDTNTTTES